jgi:hypothetical protein
MWFSLGKAFAIFTTHDGTYLTSKHVTQQHESHMMLSRRLVLLKSKNPFHLSWKKLDHLHLKDFLKYEREFHLKQPLTPTQRKTTTAYCAMNNRVAIETRRWSTVPISNRQ